MSPAIQDKGNRVLIEGFTNLPDGALISYEVEHERILEWMHDGHVPVKAGHFIQALDVRDWPPGRIKIWVAFQTILGMKVSQPPEVIARYGQMGERIEGNQVSTSGALRRVELEKSVIKR